MKYINKNDLSSALFDAYDVKDRVRAYGIHNIYPNRAESICSIKLDVNFI